MIADWVNAHLPAIFLKHGFGGAAYWQILCVPVAFVVAWVLARVLTAMLSRIALRVAKLTKARWDDLLVDKLKSPSALLLTGVFGLLLLPIVDLPEKLAGKVASINYMLTLVSGFWALLRSVDIVHETVRSGSWFAGRPAALPVLALGVRIAKIAIFVLGLLTSMQQLGYPVAGLLAGLGVGGLAVALAAQKTLENLLGSVMLSVDQPMRAGDVVIVDGTTGVVEQIGLRSTQLRTPARTIVTLPNGKLADAKIENLSARDRMHLTFVLALEQQTKPEVVNDVITDLKKTLSLHARVFKEGIAVHLQDVVDYVLKIEATCWVVLEPGEDFRDVRQEVLFAALRVVADRGATLAASPFKK